MEAQKKAKGERYKNTDDLAAFGHMINSLGGSGDIGQLFPKSDADDLVRGALFIPEEVTLARRKGQRVLFDSSCKFSMCCWYWKLPNGRQIYHYEHHSFEMIRDAHAGTCPACGNSRIEGGTHSD